MVVVGNKVAVAPMYGQKDNTVIVGVGGVVGEGDYNTWTLVWSNLHPSGLSSSSYFDVLIDEKNGNFSMVWRDSSSKRRFGIYNLSDFSTVYESSSGSHYTEDYPQLSYKISFGTGMVQLDDGGFSQSIQTYLLVLRDDAYTIEVWRGGASALWSRDVRDDFHTNNLYFEYGGISLCGEYIMLSLQDGDTWDYYLSLYKGSSV